MSRVSEYELLEMARTCEKEFKDWGYILEPNDYQMASSMATLLHSNAMILRALADLGNKNE